MDRPDLDIEFRTFAGQEMRATMKPDGKPCIEGYATVFDQYSADLGGFVEIIEPGFFDDVLDNDVRSLLNHDPNFVLGRTANKTLEISQDQTGLYQCTYPPVVEPDVVRWAADLMISIKRGDITQQSFAFQLKRTYRGDAVDGDEWFVAGDLIVRRLLKGGCRALLDVSPVTYPAYPQTNVSANTRSQFNDFRARMGQGRQEPPSQPKPDHQAMFDLMRRKLALLNQQ